MSLHQVEFEYKLPEFGTMEIDLDASLDHDEKEQIVLREIEEMYDDIEDITITSIKTQ